MSDREPSAVLPDPVLRQLERVESSIESGGFRVRKEPSRLGTLHEFDLWAELSELPAVERALAPLGFEPFRSARQTDHRFFIWNSDGHWIKVDVKLAETGGSVARDVWWLARRRRGLVVALLGADGAGKSTAAACVQSSMPIDVKLRYLGTRKRRGVATGAATRAGQMKPRKVSPIRQFAGLVKWLLLTSAAVWSIELAARRGSVVVCDRHPIEAGFLGDEPPTVKRIKRIAARRLFSRPHLVVLLAAPGEVLHARKHEHTPETLDRMTAKWRVVCEEFGGVEVDATLEAHEVCWELQREIWSRLMTVRAR